MDSIKLFKKVTDMISTIFLYILLLALVVGMAKTLLDIRFILLESLESGFNHMVTSVLTVFIVIDLFKAFVDYQENDRIKLTDITDATILIVLREIAVGLYAQKFGYEFVLSLATLLLVLGIMRVLAVKYSPAETQEPHISVPREERLSKTGLSVIFDRYNATHENN
ncbi:phosphate-starvation-inducible PsiE family protein [Methanosarcina sp.]|uniref:phosphate-starvation-inducible PsiE family protein n=1 Tax=Methanosarcina sp. TaxID=2213 RepID=UPI003C743A0E